MWSSGCDGLVLCSDCGGNGLAGLGDCDVCGGTGRVIDPAPLTSDPTKSCDACDGTGGPNERR